MLYIIYIMLADYYCLTQGGKSIIVNTLSKMVYLWNPCYGGRVFVVFFPESCS